MAIIRDVTLEMDDFGKNKIVSGIQAEAQELYNLLTMVPGDCADDPYKGIDMKQYRIGTADITAIELKSAIKTQIEKYCSFQISDIEVMYNNGELVVGIQTPSSSDIIIFTTSSDNILMNIINS